MDRFINDSSASDIDIPFNGWYVEEMYVHLATEQHHEIEWALRAIEMLICPCLHALPLRNPASKLTAVSSGVFVCITYGRQPQKSLTSRR